LEKQLRLERERQEQLTGTMTLAAKMGRSIPKLLHDQVDHRYRESRANSLPLLSLEQESNFSKV
jgi:hypothetical protein